MPRSFSALLPLLLITAIATPAIAETRCTPATLAGNWVIDYSVPFAGYTDGSGTQYPAVNYQNFCNARFTRQGAVSGTCYNATSDWTWTLAGTVVVDRACVMRMTIDNGGTTFEAVAQVGATVGTRPSFFLGLTARLSGETSLGIRLTDFTGFRRPAGVPDIPAPASAGGRQGAEAPAGTDSGAE